ncbi:MAG: vitamin B12-dependent ribonucleotide reductase, partial [bacterium]|nr:vitamin B12-dependent ribonucleotide reductase [bacterium]
CNLASVNLVAFYNDRTGVFDIDSYLHAVRLWTLVLEISVAMAHFPSRAIAQGSYDYRTLGLGYANLGSLLMQMGIPYDSRRGRAIAGALTSILTGHSYTTSAEIASAIGPFPRFKENREAMLRVIRNHRRAAYDAPASEYEGISQHVAGISSRLCPLDLAQAAREVWDVALDLGALHGFRNAQVTCIAPTGTIGLQMDCDTTGVEPDFALVKFKKLAGGGYFKIVNQSVGPALDTLGYTPEEKREIIDYVVGTSSLEGSPHINRRSLRAHGFADEDLDRIEESLPGMFELRHAFNVLAVGEPALRRLGVEPSQSQRLDFDLLSFLGFSSDEIDAAGDYICGRQTIEGAPHLKEEHLPVFDTANRNGRHGRRFIHHNGHIRMMAAAQPFISGAISKTINMPSDVSPDDIKDAYDLSWKLGLKSMALYRDGSKASQPLSSAADDSSGEDEPELDEAIGIEQRLAYGPLPEGTSPSQAYSNGMKPPRFLLPSRRAGWTQEARVGGHKLYIRTGEYNDGTLGELFIDLAKEGATLRGILSCFAIAVSKGLQYGVPLEEFVDTFMYQTFEPRGLVQHHPNIKMASSMVDYIFRALAIEYLEREDLGQVRTPELRELPEEPHPTVSDRGQQLPLAAAQEEDNLEAVKEAAQFADSPASADLIAQLFPEAEGAGGTALMPSSAQILLSKMMGDAPMCDECGHMTVRNGSCYRCLNCGASLGCS